MKQTIDYLVEILYAGAFLVCWLGTAGLLWVTFGIATAPPDKLWGAFVALIRSNWGIVLFDAFAAVFFLIGLYFLAQLLQARRRWKRIQHESPRGPVEISLFAIRSYIERLLADEFGLRRYRVALENTSNGLYVFIRAELPIGQNVIHTAERIQQTVEETVEDRVGVKVHRVQVIAVGITTEIPEERPLFRSGGEIE
ncbi:MAG: alkaline shock response membrane anchor protein AmaP [Candidatus Bipolaricaulota bacterium]|nr:alkaline shock response membrane anchor protein AmaP [Candidatus Bipolaricaulota bacterium]